MPIENTLTAEQVMTRQVLTLSEQTTVLEAATLFIERGISGAPVIDKDGRLVGILSEEDLVGVFYEGHRDLAQTPLGTCAVLGSSLVTRRVTAIALDTPAREIAKRLMIKKIKRVPVIDADRKVLGIVSRRDLLKAMVEAESARKAAKGGKTA